MFEVRLHLQTSTGQVKVIETDTDPVVFALTGEKTRLLVLEQGEPNAWFPWSHRLALRDWSGNDSDECA